MFTEMICRQCVVGGGSKPSCLESLATLLTPCMGGEDTEEENSSILHLELSGCVFHAGCLLIPCFHGWACARFPHPPALLPLQDGDQGSWCHHTALLGAQAQSFKWQSVLAFVQTSWVFHWSTASGLRGSQLDFAIMDPFPGLISPC